MFSKHGAYVVLKKSKMWKCRVESSKTFMMWCTCPSIMEKQLMTSKSVGGLLWEKAFINISLLMHGQIISGLITINLVNDNIYHGLVFKILLYNVIHLYALCLCLQNYGWWVFEKCPIPTKTPKRTLNHIMVRWNVGLLLTQKALKAVRLTSWCGN